MNPKDRSLEFHARHVMLDAIGEEGVEKLAQATVLLIGVGGLGCPTAQCLASCGVGNLILVDDDKVERANLQRQTLYREDDISKYKVAAAASFLQAINPDVTLEQKTIRVSADNLPELVGSADIVIDASDNFPTRHSVNAACVRANKSLVIGAAEQFDGQVMVFDFSQDNSPCYNCLYPASGNDPQPTPCATLGVFAPLTATIGSVMATEAMRLLCFANTQGLRSQLLAYDALGQRIRQISINKAQDCAVCSTGGNNGD